MKKIKSECPENLLPEKLDNQFKNKTALYLGSYIQELDGCINHYYIFRFDDKMAITIFWGGKPQIYVNDKQIIIEQLNKNDPSSKSYWTELLRLYQNSEKSFDCQCGGLKDGFKSRIGHFHFCPYMKEV
jgi:hypothetical protein